MLRQIVQITRRTLLTRKAVPTHKTDNFKSNKVFFFLVHSTIRLYSPSVQIMIMNLQEPITSKALSRSK